MNKNPIPTAQVSNYERFGDLLTGVKTAVGRIGGYADA